MLLNYQKKIPEMRYVNRKDTNILCDYKSIMLNRIVINNTK